MKKITNLKLFSAIVILLLSNFAHAEYQLVYTAKDTKYYVDLESRVIKGSFIKVWEYDNYAKKTDLGEMSARALTEYNCDKKEWRVPFFMSYSKPDLEGTIVAKLKKKKAVWHKAIDDQVDMTVLNLVCKVKS